MLGQLRVKENRFGKLLRALLHMAEIQSQTLAVYLNYDTSYISKWINGAQIPAQRSAHEICDLISDCVVQHMTASGRELLFQEYQVFEDASLKQAVLDHLELEYDYIRKIEQSKDNIIAGKTSFFSEIVLTEFISKMRHPALRRVKSLQVVAAMDILGLDKTYRQSFAAFDREYSFMDIIYPGVLFSLVISMDCTARNNNLNAVFIMNLLTNFSNVNFNLYADKSAAGKLAFAVKNAYCISGMLISNSHCIAVTTSEDESICQTLYNRIEALCNPEALLVKKTSIREMLEGTEYLQSVLSNDLRLLIGHITETYLPDDLFEELLAEWQDENKETLRCVHVVTQGVLKERNVRVILHESVLSHFAVSGNIDFFGKIVTLSYEQRSRFLKHISDMADQNPNHQIKIIKGGLLTDYKHIPNPTAFLSDTVGLLRLGGFSEKRTVNVINKHYLQEMFLRFFDTLWHDENLTGNGKSLTQVIRHAKESIELLGSRFKE